MHCNSWGWRALAAALLLSLLAGCGGGGGGDAATPAVLPGNVLRVSVDAGPPGSGYNVNRLYTDVTVCEAGSSSRCQTINHVLVDTGSTGLRLLASALSPTLNLERLNAASGPALLNCVQFIDNTYAWGAVARADVVLAGKTAAGVPLQIVADPAAGLAPGACSVGGSNISSTAGLGANGILGLGLYREDCGAGCTVHANNGFYYTCTSPACSATQGATASLAQQLQHPVTRFASDNNGLLIDLPGVDAAGAPSLAGSLVFGIGTQANNQLSAATLLTTNADGYIGTLLAGQTLNRSFIDTGSKGSYFDLASLPLCAGDSAGFYCPTVRTTLAATLRGVNGQTAPVSFAIDNALTLFASASNAVLPTLAGPLGDADAFDWGLPFFYGRRVFIGFDGPAATPFYAF